MMKKIDFLVLFIGIMLPTLLFGQRNEKKYWEYGVFLGGAAYQGELAEGINTSEDWGATGGILLKYHFDRKFALRMGVNAGTISGNDENSDYAWRRNRNLNFRSRLYELNVMPEIHLFTGPAFNKGVHVYLNAGMGLTYFNPQTFYQNKWIDLQHLGTEGQGLEVIGAVENKYQLLTLALPIGLGIEFNAGNGWFISVDAGYRFTLTDYLDDVSGYYPDPSAMKLAYGEESLNYQLSDRRIEDENYSTDEFEKFQLRGDPSTKDRYIFFGICITKKSIGLPCNAF